MRNDLRRRRGRNRSHSLNTNVHRRRNKSRRNRNRKRNKRAVHLLHREAERAKARNHKPQPRIMNKSGRGDCNRCCLDWTAGASPLFLTCSFSRG